MSLTSSNRLALGRAASDFELLDTVSGKILSLAQLRSNVATVIMFICNHCPYVKHVQKGIIQLADDYLSKNVSFIAISSNDVMNYPEDAPDKMKKVAQEMSYPFPFLYDESQEVAKAYNAACTPDFYIFDGLLKLVYHGQMDDSRPGNSIPVTGSDLRVSLNAILAHQSISPEQKPSIGCNIKFKEN